MSNRKMNGFFAYVLLAVVLYSCQIPKQKEKPNFKYLITQPKGFGQEPYYSLSEIEYLPSGCIRFLQYAYGRKDTITICGSFTVENYR